MAGGEGKLGLSITELMEVFRPALGAVPLPFAWAAMVDKMNRLSS